MNSRQFSSHRFARQSASQQNFDFEKLEERRLLAADFLTNVSDSVPVEDRISYLRDHLGMDRNESLDLISLERDQFGFAHFKYQLQHNGIPVEFSNFTVHVKNGEIETLSGNYIEVSDAIVQPRAAIDAQVALGGATDHLGADLYAWEVAGYAESIGAEGGTPEGELVYYRGNDGKTTLTYKFDVIAAEPFSRHNVYVDALNGSEVVGAESLSNEFDVAGTGTTLYDGIVGVTVDRYNNGSATEYRLRQGVEGNPGERPIRTLNAQGTENTLLAVDYTSATSDFSDPSVQNGVQIHYGVENAYDYFLFNHGRDSYDGNGSQIISFGSYGNNWENARWTGTSMQFGDGDAANGGRFNPLTSPMIVGHELTHGVVQTSADLRYQFQSGALNESFADIFGVATERYARRQFNWLIGEEVTVSGNSFRNMADPNANGHPDTYQGDFWYRGLEDNGGVHINSGVQNKWFYLLTEGEIGTNDNGENYDVQAIGFNAAAAIAYRNLTVYLTDDSSYDEARIGGIQAAIDIYGAGSQEHLSTVEAWYAVGLGREPEIVVTSIDGLFRAERPLGSQIYKATINGTVELQPGSPGDLTNSAARDIYSVRLDANQTLSALAQSTDGVFEPVVRVQGPSGLLSEGEAYGEFGLTLAVPATEAGIYTIIVSGGESGTLGDYEMDVFLNTEIENEAITMTPNDSALEAQQIDWPSVPLGSGFADRIAVTGNLSATDAIPEGGGGDGTIYYGEGFESGVFDTSWVTQSTREGRIRISDIYEASSGSFALLMDSGINNRSGGNEAIWTVNMEGVPTPHLNFSYMENSDGDNPLGDQPYVGSVDGDGVSISSDGITWYPLIDDLNSPRFVWESTSFDLTQFAIDSGVDISGEIQIKFQQFGNLMFDASEGRAWDDISISDAPLNGDPGDPVGVGDWYAFEVDELETISLAVAGAYGGEYTVELYDKFGLFTQAASTDSSQNVSSFITPYENPYPGPFSSTFYAKVYGVEGDYNLLVTRDSIFNVESMDVLNNELAFVDGGMGYLSSPDTMVVEPDDFEDDVFGTGFVIDTYYSDITFSNNVTGGSVFVEDVFNNDVVAPTNLNVFTPEYDTVFNWKEGVNELRVDFAEPQMFVSFDSKSDDTDLNSTDSVRIRAFSASGELIDEVTRENITFQTVETVMLMRAEADIAYIVAAGYGSDAALLDNFQYGSGGDTDVFTYTAAAGEDIVFGVFIPGGGPGEFRNGLVSSDGTRNVTIELVDSTGMVVDSGPRFVQMVSEEGGIYEIRVSATGSGEYYLGRNPGGSVVGIDFGNSESPIYQDYTPVIADTDYSVGLGYGWSGSVERAGYWEIQRGDDLLRDVVKLYNGNFDIDVPNGTYDVTVHLGYINRADVQRVTVEGVDDVYTPSGGPNIVRNYVSVVDDGQLNFEFSGQGGLNRFIQIAGISFDRISSADRPAPGDDGSASFVNQWDRGDSVIGAKVEANGVREIRKNIEVDSRGKTLMGSQNLVLADTKRDAGFSNLGSKGTALLGGKSNVDSLDGLDIDEMLRF